MPRFSMACAPFLAPAADGFFKALSNNVDWADDVTVRVKPGRTVDVNGTLTVSGAGIIEWPDTAPVVGDTAIFTYDTLVGAESLALWRADEELAARFSVRVIAAAGTVSVRLGPQGSVLLLR